MVMPGKHEQSFRRSCVMRWALALIAAFMIAGVPAMSAKKELAKKDMKDAPTRGAVAKAGDKVTFEKKDAATHHFANGKSVTFTPADIGHLSQDDLSRGAIIGKIETEKETKEGLAPGTYRVYLRKPGGSWQIFYCQDDRPVAQADNVDGGLDNEHAPKFMDGGNSIRYWRIKFSY